MTHHPERSFRSLHHRIEQAIARGEDLDTICDRLNVAPYRVDQALAGMDAAVAADRDDECPQPGAGVNRPRVLEAFCGAGGSARGYDLAGFDVEGWDLNPQPRFPYPFHLGDAFEALAEHGHEFDAIHIGPPCQGYSPTKALHSTYYPRWITPLRIILEHIGRPYVIENVAGARSAMRNPVTLCGSSFGLGVRRHRLFETSWPIGWAPQCAHHLQPEPVDVTGTGARRLGDRLDGGGGNSRKPRNLTHAREVMGIDWMTRRELAESVPPAYTEWLGAQLLEHLAERAA